MAQKWLVLEEEKTVHVVPDTDILPHGKDTGNNEVSLSDTDCPCKPKVSFEKEKTIIIHNSFMDMAKIENIINNSNLCLRCGIDKDLIKKEKIECNVWGRNYKKHMYK